MSRVILFIDMLGARAQWRHGGADTAKQAFNKFHRIIIAASRKADPGSVERGGLETDAALLVCDNAATAVKIASHAYQIAFNSRTFTNGSYLWLRGSIVPESDNNFYRRETQLAPPYESLSAFTYSESALDAISIEKSGFKGMRLLIREELITASLKKEFSVKIHNLNLMPFRRLKYSPYPSIVEGRLVDLLWMSSTSSDEWDEFKLSMAGRLRASAKNNEEFAQAASTQVLFHEYDAIVSSLQYRSKTRLTSRSKRARKKTRAI